MFGFALSESEPSLIGELWGYFVDKFFPSTAPVYENLGMDGTGMPLRDILIAVLVGVILACLSVTAYKKVVCVFVQKVIASGAVGRENARTLDEIGYRNPAILRSLNNSARLRRVVRSLEETEHYEKMTKLREKYEAAREKEGSAQPFKTEEYRITRTDRFYIEDDMLAHAETRYETKDASWRTFILVLIGCVISYFVLISLVPTVLEALNSLLSVM